MPKVGSACEITGRRAVSDRMPLDRNDVILIVPKESGLLSAGARA
jgi:hypothetical protein